MREKEIQGETKIQVETDTGRDGDTGRDVDTGRRRYRETEIQVETEIRVAPDTELAGYLAAGYPANNFDGYLPDIRPAIRAWTDTGYLPKNIFLVLVKNKVFLTHFFFLFSSVSK